MRLIPLLLRPVIRTMPWIGFVPAGVIALGLGYVASRQPEAAGFRYLPVRLGVLTVVIALAFVFDDPATPLTDPTPIRLLLRRLIRIVSATAVAAVLVTGVLVLASDGMDLVWTMPSESSAPAASDPETIEEIENRLPPFPAGRIALETSTLAFFALGVAAWLAHRGEPSPGRVTASTLLCVYAATWMTPDSHRPWAVPQDQRWETGAPWWWMSLGVFALTVLILSWDTRQWAWPGSPTRTSSSESKYKDEPRREPA